MAYPWEVPGGGASPFAGLKMPGSMGGMGLSGSPGGAGSMPPAFGGGGLSGAPGGPGMPSFGMPDLSGSPGGPAMGGMDFSGSPGGPGAFGAPTASQFTPQQEAWNKLMPGSPLTLGTGGYGAEVGSHLTAAALDPSKMSDPGWMGTMRGYADSATAGSPLSGIGSPDFAAKYNAGGVSTAGTGTAPSAYGGPDPGTARFVTGGGQVGSGAVTPMTPGMGGGPGMGLPPGAGTLTPTVPPMTGTPGGPGDGGGFAGSPGGPGMGGGMGGAPFTSNPFYSSIADDMQRRIGQFTDQRLNAIRGNAVGVGGLGGSRQGVAESGAISGAADNFAGQLAGLGSGMWGSDQDRALSRYHGDAGRDLSRYQGDQGFYTQQRGQDLQQVGLGADLVGRGLDAPWKPIQSATGAYSPFTGYGSSTTGGQQSNWQTVLGGLLGGGKFASDMGWFK